MRLRRCRLCLLVAISELFDPSLVAADGPLLDEWPPLEGAWTAVRPSCFARRRRSFLPRVRSAAFVASSSWAHDSALILLPSLALLCGG